LVHVQQAATYASHLFLISVNAVVDVDVDVDVDDDDNETV
jgi:hypothetical protein